MQNLFQAATPGSNLLCKVNVVMAMIASLPGVRLFSAVWAILASLWANVAQLWLHFGRSSLFVRKYGKFGPIYHIGLIALEVKCM